VERGAAEDEVRVTAWFGLSAEDVESTLPYLVVR
jgi:hypothetical protein